MSIARHARRHTAAPPAVPPRARARFAAALGALVLVGAVALGVTVAAGSGGGGAGGNASAPAGEVNAMGMPVVATPGRASGTVRAGGVTVTGANWDLGRVPLLVAVRPDWTLTNTGRAPVTLGEPRAEVRKGCCPGPLTLGARTLAPGASTTLTFELSMQPGMDGPHDLAVHVPVESASGATHLTLGVVGDFRG